MLRACLVLAIAALGAVLGSSPAFAEVAPRPPPAVSAAEAKAAMEDYFAGEKLGGYILAGLGVAGLASGGLLYRSSSLRARGAAYPLLTVGLLHLAAGIFVYVASDRRIDKFGEQIDRDAAAFVTAERARMAGVSTQFTVLKIVEVTLIAGGLTMAGIGWRTDRPRLLGAGLALALEMGLTLGFDVWAAGRAHDYRGALDRLGGAVSLGRAADERPIVMLGHSGTF